MDLRSTKLLLLNDLVAFPRSTNSQRTQVRRYCKFFHSTLLLRLSLAQRKYFFSSGRHQFSCIIFCTTTLSSASTSPKIHPHWRWSCLRHLLLDAPKSAQNTYKNTIKTLKTITKHKNHKHHNTNENTYKVGDLSMKYNKNNRKGPRNRH